MVTCRVYKGVYRDGDYSRDVTVEEFVHPLTRNSSRKIDHKAETMMKLDHPNVLRFFRMINDSNSLVCEFLSKVVYDMEGEETEINNVRQLLDKKGESIP